MAESAFSIYARGSTTCHALQSTLCRTGAGKRSCAYLIRHLAPVQQPWDATALHSTAGERCPETVLDAADLSQPKHATASTPCSMLPPVSRPVACIGVLLCTAGLKSMHPAAARLSCMFQRSYLHTRGSPTSSSVLVALRKMVPIEEPLPPSCPGGAGGTAAT